MATLGAAQAEESPDGLLGDWRGLRTFLIDRRVNLELNYINEVTSNVRGGVSQETQDAEQLYFKRSGDSP
jgi:carbohydrate-selective porin OprB